jgi:hypothetical protein
MLTPWVRKVGTNQSAQGEEANREPEDEPEEDLHDTPPGGGLRSLPQIKVYQMSGLCVRHLPGLSGRLGKRDRQLNLGMEAGSLPKPVQGFFSRILLRLLVCVLFGLAALPQEELEALEGVTRDELTRRFGEHLVLESIVASRQRCGAPTIPLTFSWHCRELLQHEAPN